MLLINAPELPKINGFRQWFILGCKGAYVWFRIKYVSLISFQKVHRLAAQIKKRLDLLTDLERLCNVLVCLRSEKLEEH